MANSTYSDIDLSNLSEDAKKDFKVLYSTDPAAIERLQEFPGRIGELARICQVVGCGIL